MEREIRTFDFEVRAERNDQHGTFITGTPIVFDQATDMGWYEEKIDKDGFDNEIKFVLSMMMSECCKQFEMLPIIDNVDILRNILYSGVWGRYETVRKKREEKA